MLIRVDIDGVLCTNTDGQYERAKQLKRHKENVAKINALYDAGHEIVIWTARGATTGKDWRRLTEAQLALWGVKYHRLELNKPHFDRLYDDKAQSAP